MSVESFLSSRIKMKSGLATTAIAVSFFIIIISVAISSGFSYEIRKSISDICGDVIVANTYNDYYSDDNPIDKNLALDYQGIIEVDPVVYRNAIAQNGNQIQGVLFKGIQCDSTYVSIPEPLATKLHLNKGDIFSTYFIGEGFEFREFEVGDIYYSSLSSEDALIVFAPISEMQAINGWSEDEVSALELKLDKKIVKSPQKTFELIKYIALDKDVAVISARDKYSQLFDWLELIEYNVMAIILIMIVVASVNMISGLLILIFRNTPTIARLKTLGMSDSSIAKVFLRAGAKICAKGLIIGNLSAFAFCALQYFTHIIKLNPDNYFVSFVPINIEFGPIIIADVVAFVAIMILLLIPTLSISKVDPSKIVSEN